jgi:hypothetical protein
LPGNIDRYGKANPIAGAAITEYHGVNANHLPTAVEQRPA